MIARDAVSTAALSWSSWINALASTFKHLPAPPCDRGIHKFERLLLPVAFLLREGPVSDLYQIGAPIPDR